MIGRMSLLMFLLVKVGGVSAVNAVNMNQGLEGAQASGNPKKADAPSTQFRAVVHDGSLEVNNNVNMPPSKKGQKKKRIMRREPKEATLALHASDHGPELGQSGGDFEDTTGALLDAHDGAFDSTSQAACDWGCYLARYSDLRNAFGTNQAAAAWHYQNYGRGEGRDCTCSEANTNTVHACPTGWFSFDYPEESRNLCCIHGAETLYHCTVLNGQQSSVCNPDPDLTVNFPWNMYGGNPINACQADTIHECPPHWQSFHYPEEYRNLCCNHGGETLYSCSVENGQQSSVCNPDPDVTVNFPWNMYHADPINVCPEASVSVCAQSENQNCACVGRVWYGKKFVSGKPGAGATTTLHQLKQDGHKSSYVSGSIMCRNSDMGATNGFLYGYYKWCYCEQASCDASAVPTNGGTGNCPNNLASGSTCQPSCNAGYILTRSASCSDGTLTPATCEECGPGKYVSSSTTCEYCPDEVRRRRAQSCTACPSGKFGKHNKDWCKIATCNSATSTGGVEIPYACPNGWVEKTRRRSPTVQNPTRDKCCKATCSTFSCPGGWYHKPNAASIFGLSKRNCCNLR